MEDPPTRVAAFPDDYASWYYKEDYCLLVKDDKVVGKSESERRASSYVEGVAISSTELAQCLPPGLYARPTTLTQVSSPLGTFTTQH
jgi:hypothetical protein